MRFVITTFSEGSPRRLADRVPVAWHGTVLDGELIADRFAGTMAALLGSKRHRDHLRFVVFDAPILAGVDLRGLTWQERRERLELLAQAFDVPLELSPLVEPSRTLVDEMEDGRLDGIVLKDRTAPYPMGHGLVGPNRRTPRRTSARPRARTGLARPPARVAEVSFHRP